MRRNSRRGSAILEFAVAAIILFPCLAATFQFGYSFYIYNQLSSAISGGAKYASLRTYRCGAGNADYVKIQNAVKNVVLYGNPNGTGTVQVPRLTAANVSVSYSPRASACDVPTQVQVEVNSFTINALFKSYTLTGKPAAIIPYLGRHASEESEP